MMKSTDIMNTITGMIMDMRTVIITDTRTQYPTMAAPS
jgi:hypothetical protein